MINQKLRNKILSEMMLTEKEKNIQELVNLKIWSREQIEKRWNELEEQKLKRVKK